MMLTSGLSRKLFLSTGLSIFIAGLLILAVTLSEFNSGLKPYIIDKAEAVSIKVKKDIEAAINAGVPFKSLRGIDRYIDSLVQEHPEIKDVRLVSVTRDSTHNSVEQKKNSVQNQTFVFSVIQSLADIGTVIFDQNIPNSIVSANILDGGKSVARVHVEIDVHYINSKMTSIFFDTFVILIVVALLALEIIVVISSSHFSAPLKRVEVALSKRASGIFSTYCEGKGKGLFDHFIAELNRKQDILRHQVKVLIKGGGKKAEQAKQFAARYHLLSKDKILDVSITDARIPLFIFSFAEELQKSFLPLFMAEYYSAGDIFSQSIMQGLPISVFMFVIAALTPFAGKLVERFGNKNLFLAGILPAIIGYLICFLASNGNEIVLGRAITAVGYASITISCQSYIAAAVDTKNRARGMAVFVGVLMTATMCGTAVGAILADWLGYKPIFLIAMVFSGIAGFLGWSMLNNDLPKLEKKIRTNR